MVDDFFAIFPSSWNIHQLDEVANIIDSLHKTPQYSDIGYPMVRVTDVKGGFLDLSSTFKVAEEVFKEFTRRHKPKCGDIILSRVGTYGNASYVETDMPFCLGQNTALISPIIDSRFLYFCLQSPLLRHQIENVAVGSTQKTISLKSIGELKIPVPPKEEMEAIAHILGTLDDKIELNRRMNETLEAMAQAIFKSWFVDFDPVRAKAEGRDTGLPEEISDLFPDSFEETELGEVPKGWRLTSLEELFNDDREYVITGPFGSTLHAHDYREEGVPLILVKHVVDGHILDDNLPLVGDHKLPELQRYRLLKGDIVFTRVGAVGRSAYVHDQFVGWLISGQMLRIRIPDWSVLHPRYLAQLFLEKAFTDMVDSHALGTTRPSLNTKLLQSFRFIAPCGSLTQVFAEKVEAFYAYVQNNDTESRTLAELRDTLLPKLISGELRVKEVEYLIRRTD